MKRSMGIMPLILALAVILTAGAMAPNQSSAQTSDSRVGGYLVTIEGKQIVVEEFRKLLNSYTCNYEGASTTIPMARIRSMQVVGSGIMVVTVEGMVYNVLGGLIISLEDYIKYTTKNPITGEVQENSIDPMLVEKIVFDRKQRAFKRCPRDGKTFPTDYQYCPYDKTELLLEREKDK